MFIIKLRSYTVVTIGFRLVLHWSDTHMRIKPYQLDVIGLLNDALKIRGAKIKNDTLQISSPIA